MAGCYSRTVTVRRWYAVVMDKARENRARRAAERQGFTLRKSRTRDPLALAYGWQIMKGRRQVAHLRELADTERWLADPASRHNQEGR
jgi:hypothetical protein